VPTHEAGKELQLPAILHKPVGDGPFAAWGYVALQVESFSPRGPRSVETVTPDVACRDAYAAKTYLSTLPFVDPENIAVIGWSHGAERTGRLLIDGTSLRRRSKRSNVESRDVGKNVRVVQWGRL